MENKNTAPEKKKRSKYVFVTDFPCDHTLFHASAFDKKDCLFIGTPVNWKNRIKRWRKPLFYLGYFRTAFRSLRHSTPEDIIISWNFNIGAFAAVLSRLLFMPRTIVSLNMIAHEKSGLLLKIKQLIYNWIFKNPRFHFSVNRLEVLKQYQMFYTIHQERVFELPDCYVNYPKLAFTQGEGYVFCCGERRDWHTYIQAARLLPEVKFMGIARKKYFDKKLLKEIPGNLEMLYDKSESEFYDYLSRCAVVCIPMVSDATAGLIVMFQAAFMNKPLICTRTPALESTAINGSDAGALFVEKKDFQAIADAISTLIHSPEKSKELTEKMQVAIERFSPYNFSRKIWEYVQPLTYRKS